MTEQERASRVYSAIRGADTTLPLWKNLRDDEKIELTEYISRFSLAVKAAVMKGAGTRPKRYHK